MKPSLILRGLAAFLVICSLVALIFTTKAITALYAASGTALILLILSAFVNQSRRALMGSLLALVVFDFVFTSRFFGLLEKYHAGTAHVSSVIAVAMMASGTFLSLLMLIPALKRK
jgi:hypothetical protein